MNKIRIATVSYLNARPFLYGLRQSPLRNQMELVIDHPAAVAQMLMGGHAQIGLIPAVALFRVPGAHIVSDCCIGADGEVGSVCLYSAIPVDEIRQVYLDYQSQTSAALLRYLLKNHWRVHPSYLEAHSGYENKISGAAAGLIIGDRALTMKNRFKYCYDLSYHWKLLTGLPFVFACWAAVDFQDAQFLIQFQQALSEGIKNVDVVIESEQRNYPGVDVKDYLRKKICFRFNESMKESLDRFESVTKVSE